MRISLGRPIGETLKVSKHLLVVWSSKANNSQWVQKEIAKFTEHNSKGLSFCLPGLDARPTTNNNLFWNSGIRSLS